MGRIRTEAEIFIDEIDLPCTVKAILFADNSVAIYCEEAEGWDLYKEGEYYYCSDCHLFVIDFVVCASCGKKFCRSCHKNLISREFRPNVSLDSSIVNTCVKALKGGNVDIVVVHHYCDEKCLYKPEA